MRTDTELVVILETAAENARHLSTNPTTIPEDVALIDRVATDAEQVADAIKFHLGRPSKTDWSGFALDDVRGQAAYVEDELRAAVAEVRARHGF